MISVTKSGLGWAEKWTIVNPCMLVLTIGDAVHGFTLDSALGEFVLTHPSITAGRCRLT